jgi:quinol monooxygenase YgiN
MAAASPVYVVLVTGKLKEGQVEQFKLNFAPLAQHVKEHEEGCFTYILSTGEEPDRICIYERYVSKEYLETVHWQSEPFKAFGAKNKETGIEWIEKSVVKYHETDLGFASR